MWRLKDCDQQPIIHGEETMVVEIMSLGEIDHDPCYSMMTTSVISILHSPNVHTLHGRMGRKLTDEALLSRRGLRY